MSGATTGNGEGTEDEKKGGSAPTPREVPSDFQPSFRLSF